MCRRECLAGEPCEHKSRCWRPAAEPGTRAQGPAGRETHREEREICSGQARITQLRV